MDKIPSPKKKKSPPSYLHLKRIHIARRRAKINPIRIGFLILTSYLN